jgi:hypothetical protein
LRAWEKAIELERKALTLMSFGAARNSLATFLVNKAIPSYPKPEFSKNRETEKTLLEAYKTDSTCRLCIYYLIELFKVDPNDPSFLDQKQRLHKLKVAMMEYFNSRHIKPTGRWPASFDEHRTQ